MSPNVALACQRLCPCRQRRTTGTTRYRRTRLWCPGSPCLPCGEEKAVVAEFSHQRVVHSLLVRNKYTALHYKLFTDKLRYFRFCFAMILSVYNKWMFSPDLYGFPYPLFVTMNHMFVQFVLSAVLRYVWPRHFRPEHNPQPKDYVWVSKTCLWTRI